MGEKYFTRTYQTRTYYLCMCDTISTEEIAQSHRCLHSLASLAIALLLLSFVTSIRHPPLIVVGCHSIPSSSFIVTFPIFLNRYLYYLPVTSVNTHHAVLLLPSDKIENESLRNQSADRRRKFRPGLSSNAEGEWINRCNQTNQEEDALMDRMHFAP